MDIGTEVGPRSDFLLVAAATPESVTRQTIMQ